MGQLLELLRDSIAVRRTGSSYTAYNDDGEVAGVADSIEQAEALIASKPDVQDYSGFVVGLREKGKTK